MNAETLRRAAALMRERAEAAAGEWHPGEHWYAEHELRHMMRETATDATTDAAYVHSMSPAVALAVADWLNRVARAASTTTGNPVYDRQARDALAVAVAYLGESA